MTDGKRRIVIGPAAVGLRRRLGPTAWVVLEQLLAQSIGSAECRASVSVRSLGSELGLSKDTVARALSRLRRAGLVIAGQTRSSGGTFAAACYLIVVPDSVAVEDDSALVAQPTSARSQPTTSRPSRARRSDSQLALTLD